MDQTEDRGPDGEQPDLERRFAELFRRFWRPATPDAPAATPEPELDSGDPT